MKFQAVFWAASSIDGVVLIKRAYRAKLQSYRNKQAWWWKRV